MVEKKASKKSNVKKPKTKAKITKTSKNKGKSTKSKSKKTNNEPYSDMGIVIVDDDIEIDKEKVNEERKAYLEEARSQEASD